MLQAHVAQVQTLQNELESLRAQLDNFKGKSFQPVSHAQPIQGLRSWERPPRSFYGLSHNAMVGEYVLSNAHNFNFTPEFTTSFCPSYFVTQEVSVAPKVSTIRQVMQTNGLAYGSSPITRAKGVQAVMSQSFLPLNTECCNPTLAKCGGEAQHLEKLEVGSLPGLPNVQSSTARPKTPCIGVFLVSLKSS